MSVVTSEWVSPKILSWARERLRLSPEDVEAQTKALGKSYSQISAKELKTWEAGLTEPALEQLESLAEVYVCPLGYFFLDKQPEELRPFDLRGLAPLKKIKSLSEQTLRRFTDLADWTSDLIKSSGIDWSIKIPKDGQSASIDVDKLVASERVRLGFKTEIRKSWGSPLDAFEWWRSRIEELGIFCFIMKLASEDIRGASIWRPSGIPAILVNHEDMEAHTGRIFTLLHEYGHFLLRRYGYACDFRGSRQGTLIESQANNFAAHMLINEAEFSERLRELKKDSYHDSWGDSTLDEIRKGFFVSRDVVAIKIEETGLAPEGFYKTKRSQWDNRNYRPFARPGMARSHSTKAERKFREIGFSLAKVLSQPSIDQHVPLLDLSYVLDMKVKQTGQFLTWLRENPGNKG